MKLIVDPQGTIHCIYDEQLDLSAFGTLVISRASHVEPDTQGRWQADLAPVGGPLLGPFVKRSEALEAEHEWLERYWLAPEPLP